MKTLSVSNLIGIKYLQKNDISLIFELATHFKEVINRPIKKVPSLRDVTIANLFFENSTRTKLSFEIAEKRLSADIINFSSSNSSLKKGESLLDTVQNILAMKVDMIVVRHPNPGVAFFLSKKIKAIIINAGDGTHEHPTQGLLDCYSLLQKFGTLKEKRIAIVGDIAHSRVALSNIYALKKLGAEICLCSPVSLMPKNIQKLGVLQSTDLLETLKWSDAVNMLRVQRERMHQSSFPCLRDYALQYGLTKSLIEKIDKPMVILHPGPINRGIEITSEVADSNQAMILDQVENGVAIRMAVIYLLASKLKISTNESPTA
ncbi:MAG: aspartate carbamoyltransferase catalytic subunit [Flavobacteriaceae bacterium]|nr:aspartate carbamoyltransferase catalytic subunit [Flavobacteriaceae bacterium]MCY4266990.1 aspartate carbamoyltransferase catalytic subunit [Flavobacteriaceae bacterium]MCY4298777.1 aspartate carbamoyltransferase catalytic subunit [Flavobacteriaceae bacterium]